MRKGKLYWVLFAQCIVVKGAKKYIICDLQRNAIYVINEGIYEILTKYKNLSINEVKSKYKNNFDKQIEDNMQFLISNQLVFITESPNWFPRMNLEWDKPQIITNAIVEICDNIQYLDLLLNQLERLGCFHVEINISNAMKFSDIDTLLSMFDDRKIRNVNLNIFYHKTLSNKVLKNLLMKYQRVGKVHVFLTPINFIEELGENIQNNIKYHRENIVFSQSCGSITDKYFVSGIELFTEAQHHNTCLNRKISIDVNGDIKNCPSMPESFGNIRDTTLEEAINKPGFKKYWNINKDKIHVCKDCEFRYICTDCRAYIEDPEDIYSKPLKCGYNPYTGEWEEWSTNPLKQKVIDHYGMQDLVKQDK